MRDSAKPRSAESSPSTSTPSGTWCAGTAYLLCGDWHLADDLAQITFVRLAAA